MSSHEADHLVYHFSVDARHISHRSHRGLLPCVARVLYFLRVLFKDQSLDRSLHARETGTCLVQVFVP